jgi:hypothetical protein
MRKEDEMHPIRHFMRHFVEMILVMMVGMAVLGGAAGAVYDVSDRPALLLVVMALAMTIPMVAWMRFRGHGWRLCNEMAAAMLIPAVAALALLGSGQVTDSTALGLEHAAMLPSMLAAMLLRSDEYSGRRKHTGSVMA